MNGGMQTNPSRFHSDISWSSCLVRYDLIPAGMAASSSSSGSSIVCGLFDGFLAFTARVGALSSTLQPQSDESVSLQEVMMPLATELGRYRKY